MADAPNTVATLNGLFKEAYPDGIRDLIPDGLKIQKNIPFVPKSQMLGNQYHQPVVLAYPAGFTYAAASSGAFSLNDSAAGTMKDAQIVSQQILLRDQLDYESAARAQGTRNAFVDATQLFFKNMQKSIRKRIEVAMLYGGTAVGIGKVSSYSNPTITLAASDFAPGIWAGMEGASIDVYNGTGSSKRGTATISSVDIGAKTVTLSADVSGTTANDLIYFSGAYGQDMVGIVKILNNTGSLFNIDASTYSLWKANTYSAGSAALTFSKVRKAVALAVGKGLDEDIDLYVNPGAWDDLMNDLAALRRFTESKAGKGSSYQIGANKIEFFSQNGTISIEPSIYIKEGLALGLSKPYWKRIGAADVTFNTPGAGDQIFFHLPTKAGVEARCYTNQAVFCEAPAKQLLISSIVNSA